MKTFKTLLLGVAAFVLCATVSAQMAVVDYMKVHNTTDYLEIEKEWKKLHEVLIQDGKIQGWALYQVMFAGADDPYQYVTVTTYENMKSYVNAEFTIELAAKAHPDKTEAQINELMKKTGTSRTLSTTQAYWRMDGTETSPEKPNKYFWINHMTVEPGGGQAYTKGEIEIFKPYFEEVAKRGYRNGWSLWQKWPGDLTKEQYVTVDVYAEMGQGAGMTEEIYNEIDNIVYQGKDMTELSNQAMATRVMGRAELWKLVDYVSTEPDSN